MLQSNSICLIRYKNGSYIIINIYKPNKVDLKQWILVENNIVIDFSNFANCKITKKYINNNGYFYEIIVPDDYSKNYIDKLLTTEVVSDVPFKLPIYKLLSQIYK